MIRPNAAIRQLNDKSHRRSRRKRKAKDIKYTKQIMIDMDKDNYKDLKDLSFLKEAWRIIANQ